MTIEDAVDAALGELRPSLLADGFDARMGASLPGNGVEVILEAKPEACLDCLVPDHVIIQIVRDAIERTSQNVGDIRLVKRGFSDGNEH